MSMTGWNFDLAIKLVNEKFSKSMDELLSEANMSNLLESFIILILDKAREWEWGLEDLCAMMISHSFPRMDDNDQQCLREVAFILQHIKLEECRALANRLLHKAESICKEEAIAAARARKEEAMAAGDAEVSSWRFGVMRARCSCCDPSFKPRTWKYSDDDEIPF